MKTNLSDFEKEKDYLICIDSDGTAINTMVEKHQKCFGPQAVLTWNLEEIEKEFLQTWEEINLYSKTRGINRFKGLVKTFEILNGKGIKMPVVDNLKNWTENSQELSNSALEREIPLQKDNEDLWLALQWSEKTNQEIAKLEKDKGKVFVGVKEALDKMMPVADIVVVSSANTGALLDEWESYDLSPYIRCILGQEAGSKRKNISALKAKGYETSNILMIGDALSDLKGAKDNNNLFYPIIPKLERESWQEFNNKALERFIDNSYQGKYEDGLIEKFNSALK